MTPKWLSYIAPLPALVMLFTMLFQSFHQLEHSVESDNSHSCCHINYHADEPQIANTEDLNNPLVSEPEKHANCLICEYEFTFCTQTKCKYYLTKQNLPLTWVPPLQTTLQNPYNVLYKQLRAPPVII